MKFGIRSLFVLGAVIALAAAAASYRAGEQFVRAGETLDEARAATFNTYRLVQSLKARAAGYELTMNEFYSTVLKFPVYRKKADDQRAAIESELAVMASLNVGDPVAATALAQRFRAMEPFRNDLEASLNTDDADWDAAREALFKLNVLSVQAIQQADFLGQSASQRAADLDREWQGLRAQVTQSQRAATGLAVLAGVLFVIGVLRTRP